MKFHLSILKYLFMLISTALISNCVFAQIAVNLQLPPSGLLQKSQLWNMAIVNGSGENITLQIELSIYDSRNGNRVLAATSRLIELKGGVKQLRMNDISPVQYQYMNPLYNIDANQNGILPVGIFKVCYNFFRSSTKGSELMLEECRELEIAPISPPVLNLPEDTVVLKTKYPQFSWIPPAPLQSFKGLNYELRVVELQKGQNSSEAMQKNLPFAEKGNLKEAFFAYPSSLPAFAQSQLYAWQITAFDASGYTVKSEIWTFSIAPNAENKLKVTNAYVWLKRGEDPSVFVSNGKLKFTYENLEGDSNVTFQIVNLSGKKEQIVRNGVLKISNGQNFIELSLEEKRFWKENDSYRFELISSKGEKWKLNIKFIEKDEE
jgi:hypothetical protein